MRKTRIISAALLLVALTMVGMASCQKEKTNDTTQALTNAFTPQGEQAVARIAEFRKMVEIYKQSPDMRTTDTISLADALWNIENTFNTTYSQPEATCAETAEFKFSLNLSVDSEDRVLTSDLLNLYVQIVALTREAYANDGFTDKVFRLLTVEADDPTDGTVQLHFTGRTGERALPPGQGQDTAMYLGPFDTTDNWHYACGKCVGTCLESSAANELKLALQRLIGSQTETPPSGMRAIYINSITLIFDGYQHSNDVFYRTDTSQTCIDFNNMNRLYQRERRLIFETLPNSTTGNVYGYCPVSIIIEGQQKIDDQTTMKYITHENTIIYTQRLMADIESVGETQDLLDN